MTGTVLDPILGPIAKLLNVPKSSITGGELQMTAKPTTGLTMGVAASYIQTEVRDHFTGFDSFGRPNVDFDGTRLPFAPDWQVSANIRYTTPVSDNVNVFLGGNMSYQSESFSDLGEIPQTRLKPYTLVDLQAGIESPDGNWQAYVWGRNVFDTFYNVNRVRLVDTISGFAGRPATYGVTVSYNFR